ncbi:hypothetical protein OWR29_00800 [Actinoplanes sp. Pm04-4]|uniref:Uncharacterized protein n=1 Tax=Paractinoplanes pyxinae TaxID=2997416 RepID=A0ABT4AQR1_9ACTN|nr:hypothetical protein [Actinoplanes pyxinae]MCY1136517.1 hypothetical protein [Actinoplanes pyxinae]
MLLILGYAPPWANGGHADDNWFPVVDSTWRAIVDATNKGNYGDGSTATRRLRYWQLAKIAHEMVDLSCGDRSGTGQTVRQALPTISLAQVQRRQGWWFPDSSRQIRALALPGSLGACT